MTKTVEIILCSTCKGSGQTSYEECVNYHKREYDTIYKTCYNCKGSGRLKHITTVEIEPYCN
jgi:DnaJ-class molecular chaperone